MERVAKAPSEPTRSAAEPAPLVSALPVHADAKATEAPVSRTLSEAIHNSPRMLAQRRQIEQVAQRRVHRWDGQAWVPGEKGREGVTPFPEQPGNEPLYFNDLTGQAGKTAKQAAASLETLSAQQGSVKTLMADGGESLQSIDREMKKFPHDKGSDVQYLGYFSFSQANEEWDWDPGGDKCSRGPWTGLVGSFLRNFMVANGQMDYIRSRDWYTAGTHTVEIDVNYYIDRPFATAPLYWHKDTGGGNLFVNLIFTNAEPIVGTEVTPDTRPMSGSKRESLLANMPAEQVEDIEQTRGALGKQAVAGKIGGDDAPASAYLSWVDELNWHSSPYLANRAKWSPELAAQVLTQFVSPDTRFKQETATTFEAMVLIAATPGTELHAATEKLPNGLDFDEAVSFFDEQGYNLTGKRAEAVRRDISLVPWASHKLNEAFGHEQDGDDPRVNKPRTLITPSGMGGRTRSLSDASQQDKLKRLVGKEQRNFLRTWVRIKPKAK